MQTQLSLEERYCDAIFNQRKDFSKILALMLAEKDLDLLESKTTGEDDEEKEMDFREAPIDILTILSIYQRAVFAGIKDTHTDTMLLHFLANQPTSAIPKIKQFTSSICGARFFSPVLDSTFYHLDLSLLESENIFPSIHAFIAHMFQKPHCGINLNIVINEPNDIKLTELKRVLGFFRPFLSKHQFHESIHSKGYAVSFCMSGNLIPSLGSAFRPVHLAKQTETSKTERTEFFFNEGEPPGKKPRQTELESDLITEVNTKLCVPM